MQEGKHAIGRPEIARGFGGAEEPNVAPTFYDLDADVLRMWPMRNTVVRDERIIVRGKNEGGAIDFCEPGSGAHGAVVVFGVAIASVVRRHHVVELTQRDDAALPAFLVALR